MLLLERWLVVSFALAAGACSSTSTKNLGPCGNESDGCISVSVTNAEPAPYGATDERNGKGTLYLALLNECPSPSSQFTIVSDTVVVADVDLASNASYRGLVSYRFDDTRYSIRYAQGDTAYLTGLLDDNETVTDISTPFPDNGDTLISCVPVVLEPGKSLRSSPLMPCILFDTLAPYVFTLGMECEAYEPFIAMFPDAGADGGTDAGN